METNQDIAPVGLASVDSELVHGEDASTASVSGDNELVLVEKQN